MGHRTIHCPHCGTDNYVGPDVVGRLCENCGEAIYSPEIEDAPKAPIGIADRADDVLRVTCPHCLARNEFPDWDTIWAFICHECGKPVSVQGSIE